MWTMPSRPMLVTKKKPAKKSATWGDTRRDDRGPMAAEQQRTRHGGVRVGTGVSAKQEGCWAAAAAWLSMAHWWRTAAWLTRGMVLQQHATLVKAGHDGAGLSH